MEGGREGGRERGGWREDELRSEGGREGAEKEKWMVKNETGESMCESARKSTHLSTICTQKLTLPDLTQHTIHRFHYVLKDNGLYLH